MFDKVLLAANISLNRREEFIAYVEEALTKAFNSLREFLVSAGNQEVNDGGVMLLGFDLAYLSNPIEGEFPIPYLIEIHTTVGPKEFFNPQEFY